MFLDILHFHGSVQDPTVILNQIYINICYLPDGRSVLEKYFVEVSKTARSRKPRDVFETETKYFSVQTELNGK